MATYLGIVELGGLYKSGAIQPRPTLPWRISSEPYTGCGVGNIADFSTLQDMTQWTIGDTPANAANKLKWHKIQDGSTTLLVCDRVILVNVSWADLNGQNLVTGKTITIDGQPYKIRLLTGGNNFRSGTDNYSGGTPTNNEWDRFITREEVISGLAAPESSDLDSTLNATDRNSTHNQLWNWMGVYSWVQETYIPDTSYRCSRGYFSARCFYNYTSSSRYGNVGWRPALEILNTAPLISDSDGNLGGFAAPLVKPYTVSDAEGNTFTIVEKLDGTTIRTLNNQTNGSFTLDLTSQWPSLSLASHTVIVEATDQNNAKSTRTWTFTKTNSVAAAPVITSPVNNQRVPEKPEILFTIGSDPEDNSQTFKARFSSDAGFSTYEDITTGFEIQSGAQWLPLISATNANAGATARLIYPNTFTPGTVKYVKIGTTDSGSNTTNFSAAICIKIGNVLEFQTVPSATEFKPSRINVLDKKVIDPQATLQVFACNNALDASPAWEDMTAEYASNHEHVFTNATKTNASWAVAVKYVVQANNATGTIEIQAIGVGVS